MNREKLEQEKIKTQIERKVAENISMLNLSKLKNL